MPFHAQGVMTEAGLAAIEVSKLNGTWTVYDQIEALQVPEDLQTALNQQPVAQQNFAAFSLTIKMNRDGE